MKTNQIEIRQKDINPAIILKVAFNKQEWGRSYTLYTCGSITVEVTLKSFHFDTNKGVFEIKSSLPKNDKIYSYTKDVEFYQDKDTLASFTKRLQKRCLETFVSTYGSWGIFNDIAERECQVKSLNSWNITNAQIIEAGYEDELAEIEEISNSVLAEAALDALTVVVKDKLNQPYIAEIRRLSNLQKQNKDYQKLKELIEESK